MTLATRVPGRRVGCPNRDLVRLASVCPGMGWISAVGVTQQAHRTMLSRANRPCPSVPGGARPSDGPEGPVFAERYEVRKNLPFPISGKSGDTTLWSVYIDNLNEDEIFQWWDAPVGTTCAAMSAADARYVDWDSPSSTDKAVNRQPDRQSLGVRISGELGRLDSPATYILRLIGLACWLCSQDVVYLRWLQVLAGR